MVNFLVLDAHGDFLLFFISFFHFFPCFFRFLHAFFSVSFSVSFSFSFSQVLINNKCCLFICKTATSLLAHRSSRLVTGHASHKHGDPHLVEIKYVLVARRGFDLNHYFQQRLFPTSNLRHGMADRRNAPPPASAYAPPPSVSSAYLGALDFAAASSSSFIFHVRTTWVVCAYAVPHGIHADATRPWPPWGVIIIRCRFQDAR